MKNLLLYVGIGLFSILSIISRIKANSTQCKTHLDCIKSACCVNEVCDVADVCQENMNTVYIVISLIGFGFLVLAIMYFVITLRKTAQNVKSLKEKFLRNMKGEA